MGILRDLFAPDPPDPGPGFTRIRSTTELDALFSADTSPAVLYLHDPHCGMSAMALEQVQQLESPIAYIDVDADHDLSMEVERRTRVRHESPQLFVLRDGAVTWAASHRGISAKAVRDAMAAAQAANQPS